MSSQVMIFLACQKAKPLILIRSCSGSKEVEGEAAFVLAAFEK